MKFVNTFLISCLIICSLSVFAETKYYPDSRAQLPSGLNNTYFGGGVDYSNFPFSNNYLLNGIHATSFNNADYGLNIFLGHYFNPYIAAEVSLMRPIKWCYANGITSPTDTHSIWISIFGYALRPTYPINDRWGIYGLTGLGLVSRHGFNIGPTVAIPSKVVPTFLTGGGLTYAINAGWHLDLGAQYTLARPELQQPSTFYAFAGFYYLFHTLDLPKYYTTNYIFQANEIQIGGFETDIFNPNINKYFSIGYLPIFWTGDVKTQNGGWIMYERNIFHSHKRFSFDVGTSISTYHSFFNNTSFQAFSVFPQFRFWLIRSNPVDFYFVYSIAGPSYITQSHIDGIYIGGNFSFQDMLGFGFFLGQEKHVNVDFRIAHYSNGNTLPVNPGIEIPMVVSLGYAF